MRGLAGNGGKIKKIFLREVELLPFITKGHDKLKFLIRPERTIFKMSGYSS